MLSENSSSRQALIIGGGIGGLTAALCLAQSGFGVRVFEQSAVLQEVGAGLQLSPNASRVLHFLGLGNALSSVAFLPEAIEMRHWRDGNLIGANPLGDEVRQAYGYPYYHIHRADLMKVLAEAITAHPAIELHLQHRVDDLSQATGKPMLQAGGQTFQGDVLIGADGIHSVVRTRLFGEQAPTFTGNVAWRGLVPAERLPKNLIRPCATAWWGPGKHFVHYYVRGGQLVNCVCVVEKKGWELESWTERGEHRELKQDFAGWHPQLAALIDAMGQGDCFKWALFDRPPMNRWSEGAMTLLGDACHPTLPFMAQGAAMAIEDAAVLAACLGPATDLPQGLREYETLRRPRTARIQAGSRRNAWLFHLSGIPAWLRDRQVGASRGQILDWLYRYNALEPRKNG